VDIVLITKFNIKILHVIFADMKYLALTFFFASCLFFPACKKSSVSPTKKNNSDSTSTNSTYYFKGTINGVALNWQVNNSTIWGIGGDSRGSTDQGVFTGEIGTSIEATNGGQQGFFVNFRTYQVNYDADLDSYFNDFVKTGTWAFVATDEYVAGTKAIDIGYRDSTGNYYTSIGPQPGNSINISSVTDTTEAGGLLKSLKIKLAFNCTLYATDGTGKSLPLTNVNATIRLDNMLAQ
jgi:hypothetical protein